MRVYEYARKRNIRSRDVVKKCHELGIMTVKNHLSLIPLKRLNELDQMNFESNDSNTIRRHIFVLSIEEHSNEQVMQQVLRPYIRHKDFIYLLQIKSESDVVEGVHQVMDVVVRDQWYKVNIYREVDKRMTRYLVELPNEMDNPLKERQRLDAISICYQVAITLLEPLTVDRIIGIDWSSGLFPLTYRKLNPTMKQHFHLYLSAINYEGIYGLNELSLFFLDFREKATVEYAGSLNFYKTALLTYDSIDLLDDAKQQLRESYLRKFYYDDKSLD